MIHDEQPSRDRSLRDKKSWKGKEEIDIDVLYREETN